MNYLDKEQKQKMEKIFNLQSSIEASKERQEERISSYDNYLNKCIYDTINNDAVQYQYDHNLK